MTDISLPDGMEPMGGLYDLNGIKTAWRILGSAYPKDVGSVWRRIVVQCRCGWTRETGREDMGALRFHYEHCDWSDPSFEDHVWWPEMHDA